MEFIGAFLSEQTVERIGWVLIHFLWQGIAVGILTWCVLKVLAKASSNVRYIAACAGLVLMIIAPVATFFILTPDVPVAVTPVAFEPAEEEVDLIPVVVQTVTARPVSAPAEPFVVPALTLQQRLMRRLEAALPYCVVGWFLGVAVLSVWYLGGWCQLQKLRRIGTRAVSDCVEANASLLCQRLGIQRAVRVVESALVQVPTMVGWLKPAVLLPATALTGLDEIQLQAMIAHELAHIKRCDYLVNIAQTIVEILGFYHPAVWWASRQIRIERENCCDDIAVSLVQNKKDYAGALFTMEAIRSKQHNLAVAANGGHLESRISRLTGKPAKGHKSGWVVAVILIGIIMTGCALKVANKQAANMDDQDSKEKTINSEYQTNAFKTTLSNGVTIELLGVCEHPSEGKQWWRADGSELEQAPSGKISRVAKAEDGESIYEFAVRYSGPNLQGSSHELYPLKDDNQSKAYSVNSNKEDDTGKYELMMSTVNFPQNQDTATLRIGVSAGPWQTHAVSDGKQEFTSDVLEGEVVFRPAAEQNGKTTISVLARRILMSGEGQSLCENRVIARDSRGKVLTGKQISGAIRGGTGGYMYEFDMPLEEIAMFEYQTRSYIWTNFENVSLRPGGQTDGERSHYTVRLNNDGAVDIPLRPLAAHEYYKAGEPINIQMDSISGDWKPVLKERCELDNIFVIINGKEYRANLGTDPFASSSFRLPVHDLTYEKLDFSPGRYRFAYGWKNLDVIDPENPSNTIHVRRMITDEVEFRVVNEWSDVSIDYFSSIYQDGWDEVLDAAVEPWFTDDSRISGVAGTLLGLKVDALPFDVAFDVYAQGEDMAEPEYACQLARRANTKGSYSRWIKVPSLTWGNADEQRWRIILKPSQKAAAEHPPIRFYYNREYTTDWLTFEKSDNFDLHRERFGDSGKTEPEVQIAGDQVETPFRVQGRVTDVYGRPMVGVTVRASCGMGTLMPTGTTVTDDNGHYRFYLGSGFLTAGEDSSSVGFQAATIHAEKDGFYEANLCQHSNLAMAGSEAQVQDHPWRENFKGVVLPNEPYELNFVMMPAASIDGLVTDPDGKPIPQFKFNICGTELYPSSSVLCNMTTDEKGQFSLKSVPLKTYWFDESHGTSGIRTQSINFESPDTYKIVLVYDEDRKKCQLESITLPPGERTVKREIMLPEMDLLDLGSGEHFSILDTLEKMSNSEDGGADAFNKVLEERYGRGDICYDYKGPKGFIICVRGSDYSGDTSTSEELPIFEFEIENLPVSTVITTQKGDAYEVTIEKANLQGCTITYRPVENTAKAGIVSAEPPIVGLSGVEAWGQAVEDVKIGIVEARRIRGRSDWPYPVFRLKLMAINDGQRYLHLPENGLNWQIEVNGDWYEWVDSDLFKSPQAHSSVGSGGVLLDFNAGDSHVDLEMEIAGSWWKIPVGKEDEYAQRRWQNWGFLENDYGEELIFQEGQTYQVRVAIPCPPSRAGRWDIVRPISNPVEIQINAINNYHEYGIFLPADGGSATREVNLPEMDLLDLGSGEHFSILDTLEKMSNSEDGGADAFNKVLEERYGRGDICYDYKGPRGMIICLRGSDYSGSTSTGDHQRVPIFEFEIENLPVSTVVTTRNGDIYEVSVLEADLQGCTIKYRPVEKQAKSDPEREILLKRREILHRRLRELRVQLEYGRGSMRDLRQVQVDLLRTESELAATDAERIDYLEQILGLYQQQAKTVQMEVEVGQIPESELDEIQLLILGIRREILQAKRNKPVAPGSMAPDGAGVATPKQKEAWGEPVEGAKVGLIGAERVLGRSDWPYPVVRLTLQGRNDGPQYLSLPQNGLNWQIEVDGDWYEWVEPKLLNIPEDATEPILSSSGGVLRDFNAGDSHTDLQVEIAGNWRKIPASREAEFAQSRYGGSFVLGMPDEAYGEELILEEGRTYQIRVAIPCPPSRAGNWSILRPISNPIEVEITSPAAGMGGVIGGMAMGGLSGGMGGEKAPWEETFYTVYKLKEGEILKRIAPPFIPERKDFYYVRESFQAKAIPEPPDYFTFHWDGELKSWGMGFMGNGNYLSNVIRQSLSIPADQFEGPDKLLELPLPGDWIVRKGVTDAERLQALETILQQEFGKEIRFQKREVTRPVIVAKGTYKFTPPQGTYDDRHVHFYSDKLDSDEGSGGGTADTVHELIAVLGQRTGLQVVDETKNSSQQINQPYGHHRSSRLRSSDDEAQKRALLDQMLRNLEKQTNLTFTVEERAVEKWFVSDVEQTDTGMGDFGGGIPSSTEVVTFTDEGQEPWGPTTDGVSVRLRSPEVKWHLAAQDNGQWELFFRTDLKSGTERPLPHYGAPIEDFYAEVDGTLYRPTDTFPDVRSVGPSPETVRENLYTYIVAKHWQSLSGGQSMPEFTSGKHIIRIGFPLLPENVNSTGRRPIAFSNPVEVVIPDSQQTAPVMVGDMGGMMIDRSSIDDAVVGVDPVRTQVLITGCLVEAPSDWPQLEAFERKDGANAPVLTSDELDALLDTVENSPEADLLSRPRILVNDNEAAEIHVGGEEDEGYIKLNITPHVPPTHETIHMEFEFELSKGTDGDRSTMSMASMVTLKPDHAAVITGHIDGDDKTMLLLLKAQLPELLQMPTGDENSQNLIESDKLRRQLAAIIDLSSLKSGVPLSEALERIGNSVNPPLPIMIDWGGLKEKAGVLPTDRVFSNGLMKGSVQDYLKEIFYYLSYPSGISQPVGYIIDNDHIVIKANPHNLVLKTYPLDPKLKYDQSGAVLQKDMLRILLYQKLHPLMNPDELWDRDARDIMLDGDVLKVIATEQAHKLIAETLSSLKPSDLKQFNTPESQITIETRILTVPDGFCEDIGLDTMLTGEDTIMDRTLGEVLVGLADEENILAALENKPLDQRVLPRLENKPLERMLPGAAGSQKISMLDDLEASFLLRAVQAHKGAKLLSAPKATVLDGEVARMQVQREWPYKVSDNEIKYVNEGLTFDIQPSILNDTNVLLKGHVQWSDVLTDDSEISEFAPMMHAINIPFHAIVESSGTILIIGPEWDDSSEIEGGFLINRIEDKKRMLILIKSTIVELNESPQDAIGLLAPSAGTVMIDPEHKEN